MPLYIITRGADWQIAQRREAKRVSTPNYKWK